MGSWYSGVMRGLLVLVFIAAGCHAILPLSPNRGADDGPAHDGPRAPEQRVADSVAVSDLPADRRNPPTDGPAADAGRVCASWSPFSGAAKLQGPVNTNVTEWSPSISTDGLALYFARVEGTYDDVLVATRKTTSDPFGAPSKLAFNTGARETDPEISANNLELFIVDNVGVKRLTRPTPADAFTAPQPVALVSSDWNGGPSLSADGLTLYHHVCTQSVGCAGKLARATRSSLAAPFVTQGLIKELDVSAALDGWPSISFDGLELFFETERNGQGEIYVARRASTADAFQSPEKVPLGIGGALPEGDPDLSADGETLYLSVHDSGSWNIWVATRTCLAFR